VDLHLSKGTACWAYVPFTDDRTLDTELHSVVCEILRTADRRLASLAAARAKTPVAGSVA